jgi:hypothetical protein
MTINAAQQLGLAGAVASVSMPSFVGGQTMTINNTPLHTVLTPQPGRKSTSPLSAPPADFKQASQVLTKEAFAFIAYACLRSDVGTWL